jgi:hypothetical protein
MKNFLKGVLIVSGAILFISISALIQTYISSKMNPVINIDNSYFTNKITELNKKIEDLKYDNSQLQDNYDLDLEFLNERCVCKPWSGGGDKPMNKKEICSTPENELYFYQGVNNENY